MKTFNLLGGGNASPIFSLPFSSVFHLYQPLRKISLSSAAKYSCLLFGAGQVVCSGFIVSFFTVKSCLLLLETGNIDESFKSDPKE